jgi:RQC domain.
MSKKTRVPPMTEREIRAILRAADDIIAEGGRTLLSRILKGSKEKKLLELGLDRNPSYGFYSDLSLDEIMEKVDRMLDAGYLEIEMNGKLPTIVFTPLGWVVERERRAEEFLREWDQWLGNGVAPISMEYLKDRNRGMIFLFLYKIVCTGDPKYIPFLKQWESVDYRKVREEIRHTIKSLMLRGSLTDEDRDKLKRERFEALTIRSKQPVFLHCEGCDRYFVLDELDPELYEGDGLKLPETCRNCEDKKKDSRS